MKTAPIVAAQPSRSDDGLPFGAAFGDVYHPRSGPLTQARSVFLAGNELPARWAGRDRFVVLETGFGPGYNFLATWQAWRDDPQRCARLHFISIEKHPLQRQDLAAWHHDTPLSDLAAPLLQAWPPLTHNLHRLVFEAGAVELLLCFGDVAAWLPEIDAQVDAFYLDGFAPARNPSMWQARLYKACARLAAPEATVATWTAARAVREGLRSAGFEVHLGADTDSQRDVTLARFTPPFAPRPTPSRRAVPRSKARDEQRHALIIGGGLAGCAAAWALAEQGWHSTLLDRHAQPAQEASGNPAGLFHGIAHAQDGAHARFNRAAALQARAAVACAIEQHGVPGQISGLLRLHDDAGGWPSMQAVLERSGLPPDYVQALDTAAASARAGLPLPHPAWCYPGGGWVQPGGLARSFLERAGTRTQWRGEHGVESLQRDGDSWQALDATGAVLARATVVVLANAGDALRLLGRPDWPIQAVRGQITLLSRRAWQTAGLAWPACPIAGAGYLLPEIDAQALFGATAQPGDEVARTRTEDHRANLAQLQRLLGKPLTIDLSAAVGRVGWRWVSSDRLPLIGPVPDESASPGRGEDSFRSPHSSRLDQPRFAPRVPGLFVFTALGSRGITWAALGAQVLAACVSGAPVPLESSLLDAIDPARFGVRRRRSSGA